MEEFSVCAGYLVDQDQTDMGDDMAKNHITIKTLISVDIDYYYYNNYYFF